MSSVWWIVNNWQLQQKQPQHSKQRLVSSMLFLRCLGGKNLPAGACSHKSSVVIYNQPQMNWFPKPKIKISKRPQELRWWAPASHDGHHRSCTHRSCEPRVVMGPNYQPQNLPPNGNMESFHWITAIRDIVCVQVYVWLFGCNYIKGNAWLFHSLSNKTIHTHTCVCSIF